MKISFTKGQLLCPECGAQQFGLKNGENSRHRGVRRGYICPECHFEIPAHLAERWGGISVEDAQSEWRQVYRPLTGGQDWNSKL